MSDSDYRSILFSDELDKILLAVEEATRSASTGVKRFIEPSSGTLNRSIARRPHIIFGRRGSGKSSLLRKAGADLTVSRTPVVYVDLEVFKGNTYPDVLLNVLVKTFQEYERWLRTAATAPSTKTSFWKTFLSLPKVKPLHRLTSENLANDVASCIRDLKSVLESEDDAQVESRTTQTEKFNTAHKFATGARLGVTEASITGSAEQNTGTSVGTERALSKSYVHSKVAFLQRHVLTYHDLFTRIAALAQGEAFLFLDDLYHIPMRDQASLLDYFHKVTKGTGTWIKVGTIRHRSNWYVHGDPPVGLKLGDDADEIDLDLTLEKYELSKRFLAEILSGFFTDSHLTVSQILIATAPDRLVLASGGVARDFLNIFRRSVEQARERALKRGQERSARVGVEDVNAAAGDYEPTKREELKLDTLDDRDRLIERFNHVRDFCTKRTKKNVFLVEKDVNPELYDDVQKLVDLRLIHKVRSRVIVFHRKTQIFEAYMLDVSQYTAARKIHDFEMVEFWQKGEEDKLRAAGLIYSGV